MTNDTQQLSMPILSAQVFSTTLEMEHASQGTIYRVWWEWNGAPVQTAWIIREKAND